MEKKYSFSVDEKSRIDGKRYKGTFHMRRANIGDLGAISAALSRLNQGQPIVSDSFEALLTVVATIEICGEDVPKWWQALVDEGGNESIIIRVGNAMSRERDKGQPFRSEKDQSEQTGDGSDVGSSVESESGTDDT